jgi:demethylmenaquinone methyltransferase/2-methoxy-6-polyprenyl-1,4-benzoquinol methylase
MLHFDHGAPAARFMLRRHLDAPSHPPAVGFQRRRPVSILGCRMRALARAPKPGTMRAAMETELENRQPLQRLFAEVAPTYELVNRVLTFGLDAHWRRKAARLAAAEGGRAWMDACSGTGELAANLRALAPAETQVMSLDFCRPMLARAAAKPSGRKIDFVLADVKALPFADASLDLITISFATRNINLSRAALVRTFAEFRRVLRPGGRFVNLETSQPRSRIVRALFHAYIRLVVRRVGALISGSRAGYAYLGTTIPRFYPAEELTAILKEAGFVEVRVKRLLFGAAAIHLARV